MIRFYLFEQCCHRVTIARNAKYCSKSLLVSDAKANRALSVKIILKNIIVLFLDIILIDYIETFILIT